MLNDKKAPCIQPISLILFAKQCSIIENNSVLPSSTIPLTDQYLENIEFTKDDIKRIIWKLDPNKAHGCDIISIHMLKMSGNAIIEPFFKIFKNCLKCGIFSDDWKKGNIVPIFKQGDKKTSKTITQSLFFQSGVRFLNRSYTITC